MKTLALVSSHIANLLIWLCTTSRRQEKKQREQTEAESETEREENKKK